MGSDPQPRNSEAGTVGLWAHDPTPVSTFAADLVAARVDRKPFIALRPDHTGELDDVVVTNVKMFRAEMMSDSSLWMACYFHNSDDEVRFYVSAGKNHSAKLNFGVTDSPPSDVAVYEEGSLNP